MKPHHQHDCSNCHYQGSTLDTEGGWLDWYICANPRRRTILARFGSNGPEYTTFDRYQLEDLTDTLSRTTVFGGREAVQEHLARLHIAKGLWTAYGVRPRRVAT